MTVGNAKARMAVVLKIFKLIIVGSIYGTHFNPPGGWTFPTHARFLRMSSVSDGNCTPRERITPKPRQLVRAIA
jgi:hypothetical protein